MDEGLIDEHYHKEQKNKIINDFCEIIEELNEKSKIKEILKSIADTVGQPKKGRTNENGERKKSLLCFIKDSHQNNFKTLENLEEWYRSLNSLVEYVNKNRDTKNDSIIKLIEDAITSLNNPSKSHFTINKDNDNSLRPPGIDSVDNEEDNEEDNEFRNLLEISSIPLTIDILKDNSSPTSKSESSYEEHKDKRSSRSSCTSSIIDNNNCQIWKDNLSPTSQPKVEKIFPHNSNLSSVNRYSGDDEDSNSLDAITENFCGIIGELEGEHIKKSLLFIADKVEQPTTGRGIRNPEKKDSLLNFVKDLHRKNKILFETDNSSKTTLQDLKDLKSSIKNKCNQQSQIENLEKMESWYESLKKVPLLSELTQTLSICTFNIKKFSKNNNKFEKRIDIIAGIFKQEIKKRGLKAFDIIAIQEALSDAQSHYNQPIEAIEGLVHALNEYGKTDTYRYKITSQSIGNYEYGVFIYNQKRLKCITIYTGYPITESEIGLNGQLLKTCFGGNYLTKNNIEEKLSKDSTFRLPTYGLFKLINSFKKILICSVHFKSTPSIEELNLIDDLIPHSPQKLYEEKQIYSVLCGDFNFKNGNSTLKNKDFCSGLDFEKDCTNLFPFFAGEKQCYDNIYFLNTKELADEELNEANNFEGPKLTNQSDTSSKEIIAKNKKLMKEQEEEHGKAFVFYLNNKFFKQVDEERLGRIMELVNLKQGFDRRLELWKDDANKQIIIKMSNIIFQIISEQKVRDEKLKEIIDESSVAMKAKVRNFKKKIEEIGTLDLFTIASFLFSDHLPVGVILDI